MLELDQTIYLLEAIRVFSWVRFASHDGLGPVNSFRPSANNVSLVKFPIEENGISPYKLTFARCNMVSLVCLLTQERVPQLILLIERSRYVTFVRLANDNGISPEKFQLSTSK